VPISRDIMSRIMACVFCWLDRGATRATRVAAVLAAVVAAAVAEFAVAVCAVVVGVAGPRWDLTPLPALSLLLVVLRLLVVDDCLGVGVMVGEMTGVGVMVGARCLPGNGRLRTVVVSDVFPLSLLFSLGSPLPAFCSLYSSVPPAPVVPQSPSPPSPSDRPSSPSPPL
jgi:hypothetical protein